MISGLNGVAAYLDDLIITGKTYDEHIENLTALFRRLDEFGFRVKREKCEFFKNSVEYLGHIIDKHGKRPSDTSIDAIKRLPKPTNLRELQAFLGKINYYGRYIARMSDKAAPLYAMLKKDVAFNWDAKCDTAFEQLKGDVIDATRLAHFDDSKPLILATDASNNGVGAVLLQEIDGGEVPIAHASKTLTDSQKRYSQIEKEALSIIFGE